LPLLALLLVLLLAFVLAADDALLMVTGLR
jgi:hypothetical protein